MHNIMQYMEVCFVFVWREDIIGVGEVKVRFGSYLYMKWLYYYDIYLNIHFYNKYSYSYGCMISNTFETPTQQLPHHQKAPCTIDFYFHTFLMADHFSLFYCLTRARLVAHCSAAGASSGCCVADMRLTLHPF